MPSPSLHSTHGPELSVVLHLIRHGQSTANRAKLIAGWTDSPLTDRGREQATRLASFITPSQYASAWSSDLSRARETARLAGLTPTADARLRELNFGHLEAQSWLDVAEKHAESLGDFDRFVAPGGEPVTALRSRVFEFLDELPRGTHAVVCHGGVIRVVLSSMGTHRFVANCSLVKVDWTSRVLLAEEPLPDAPT